MAQIPGTNVIAPVVPLSTSDTHPSHEAAYGKGGYRTVATTAARDAIPAARREAGMLVHVTADGKVYQLGSNLTAWSEFTPPPGVHQHVAADITDFTSAVAAVSPPASWSTLTGKPSTFPPEAHGHSISDVTGLQTALDGKQAAGSYAAAVHTHAIADVTGLQTALDGKATPSDMSSAVAALVNSAPSTLDTLKELADALGSDANFSTTVTDALAGKVSTSDSRLTDSREWTADTVSQSEAEAGTATTRRGWTAQRVWQAIAAWWATVSSTKQDTLPAGSTGNVLTYSDGEWTAAAPAAPFDQSLNTADMVQFSFVSAPVFWNSGGPVWIETESFDTVWIFGTDATLTWPDSTVQSTAWTGWADIPTASDTVSGGVKIGSGVTITDGVISVSTAYAATSHSHGSLTSDGKIGTTSGLVVTTGASGAIGTLAQGTAGQVLRVNSTATGVEWVTLGTAASSSTSDFAAASHNHAASAINSGTLDIARIPTGTSSATVSLGDHTHSQLHDRSHAITSTSDHTAGSWKVLYTNGSGQVVELGLGDSGKALVSNGASSAPSWATAGSNSASDLTTGTLAAARIGAHASSHQTGGSDAIANTVASPSQITSDQNDYSLTSDINRISSDAARNITGVAAGSSGQVIVLVNVGSYTITLKHQSTSSTAANRIVVPWANDFAIPADGSATLVYDSTTSRWRAL